MSQADLFGATAPRAKASSPKRGSVSDPAACIAPVLPAGSQPIAEKPSGRLVDLPCRTGEWLHLCDRAGQVPEEIVVCCLWTGMCVETIVSPELGGIAMLMKTRAIYRHVQPHPERRRATYLSPQDVRRVMTARPLALGVTWSAPSAHSVTLVAGEGDSDHGQIERLLGLIEERRLKDIPHHPWPSVMED